MNEMQKVESGHVLDQEISFYEREREDLAANFPGRYLLIYGDKLIGDFATLGDATSEGVRRFGSGPFLARLAGADAPVSTTVTIF